ncbi:MAG: VCBS repeat-containing protein [Saprospiraceae bacterium]
MKYTFVLPFFVVVFIQCREEVDNGNLFSRMPARLTGVDFINRLEENPEFNVLTYTYFYNGGGVAIGDVNNDGLPDIYFTANMMASHLYINKGDWKFENIAAKAGVEAAGFWNTGVVMADVNADGWLDIYVCRSAAADPDARRNLLFINNRDLTFTEQSAAYGLDDPAYSTHAAFFDYDRDGDLDLYLLNHSVPEFTNFNQAIRHLKSRTNRFYGDKLYRNDVNTDGKFTNVTSDAGIIQNVLGFGLGVAIEDYNQDGWPDVFVSNDFNEEDYYYVNQKDGTFKEELSQAFDHTSLFSMGSDASDINNDGTPDLVTMDMLPATNYRNKMAFGPDNYSKYRILLDQGFYKQSMRNMLQINNGHGQFSEVGQQAGISATDWSWAPLVADYNLDGKPDLFISNGYLRDYTNMDFLSYTVDQKLKVSPGEEIEISELIRKMPEINVPNRILIQGAHGNFTDDSTSANMFSNTLSNGAAYADLDLDGDLDLVLNNCNAVATIYRNNTREHGTGHYIELVCRGQERNPFGIGATCRIFTPQQMYYRAMYPSRGYQSSMEPAIHAGLTGNQIDSIQVIWSDGYAETFGPMAADQRVELDRGQGKALNQHPVLEPHFFTLDTTHLSIAHQDDDYIDFFDHPTLPFFYSNAGPGMAVADLNGDGLEDLVLSGGKGFPTRIVYQHPGPWTSETPAAFDQDARFEDVAVAIADMNGDALPDVLVGSAVEVETDTVDHEPVRLYLQNSRHGFDKVTLPALPASNIFTLSIGDFDGNGSPDIFAGAPVKTGQYPEADQNILLMQANASFHLVEEGPLLHHPVRVSSWVDLDGDHRPELILASPWHQVEAWQWQDGWKRTGHSRIQGWWTALQTANLDDDPELEILVGNLGLNSPFKASVSEPMVLYYGDCDNNGDTDAIITSYTNGESYPFISRDDLLGQLPSLKKQFPDYASYANTNTRTLLTYLPAVQHDTINELRSGYFDLSPEGWIFQPFPTEAQTAPVYAITTFIDAGSKSPRILLTGNATKTRVKIGEIDANHGLLLQPSDKGWQPVPHSGLWIRGDVRSSAILQGSGQDFLIIGRNDLPVMIYRFPESSF